MDASRRKAIVVVLILDLSSRANYFGVRPKAREALYERAESLRAGVEHAVEALGIVVPITERAVGLSKRPVGPLPWISSSTDAKDRVVNSGSLQ